MFFKNCPFCDESVKERYDVVKRKFIIECNNCRKNNLTIIAEANNLDELQKIWNLRITKINDDVTIGKENYGYLIIYNGDIIKCDNSHPEEILHYLGIDTNYKHFDYESACRKIGILRISSHCGCVMLDLPFKTTPIQISKTIEILPEYNNCISFCIFLEGKQKVIEHDNINDCILELDRIK